MLQTEAALSATVRLSARSLEARVARAAEDQGAGFLRGQLRLLPRAGALADPPRVDLRLLADAFQAGHAARFPPELAASLYAGYAAGAAGPAAPRAPPRPREAEPSGAQAVERRRYEALAMCGAELQERRKQGLLARVTELSRRGFYPLAFVFLSPTDFTRTVHAIFDIAQLYAEGLITIRRYTDKIEQQRLYAIHGLQIDLNKHEYESLYVRSTICFSDTQQSDDQVDSAYQHEFDPVIWKGLSTVLSMDMERARKLSQRFGIQ
ncbi:Hypothetical protein DHA2_152216 [Giardia duodenalis]|uniref:Uncharacterized protein n=1 Tax=Giardia intestinalis TaxID=5741 RepID=V6TDB3_GIAIN|nr:Hypothetical protein DHA2_152216 [Giardia intestinalis]